MEYKMDSRKLKGICGVSAAAGICSGILRTVLYRTGFDAKGLLVSWHPLTIAIGVLLVLMTAVTAAAAFRMKKEICAAPLGKLAAAGSLVMAAAVILTTLGAGLPSVLKVLGLAAGICLAAAALFQWKNRQPIFVCHGIFCLFLAFYLINRYQIWSQDPQLMDYLMALLCGAAMLVYGYQMAAGNLSQCSRRTWMTMAALGAFCGLGGAFGGEARILCLGGSLWMLAGLWSGTTEGVEKT